MHPFKCWGAGKKKKRKDSKRGSGTSLLRSPLKIDRVAWVPGIVPPISSTVLDKESLLRKKSCRKRARYSRSHVFKRAH